MRAPINTPENTEIMITHYGKIPIAELEDMIGYKENSIRDYAKTLGLKSKRKPYEKRVLTNHSLNQLDANYDPQTYIDSYITTNAVYDENVYAYRNGYLLTT